MMVHNGLLCILLSTAWCCNAQEERPVLTVSKAKSSPVIDGTIHEEEWKFATVTTGFSDQSGALTKDDTKVYVTYDDIGLHIAFTSTVAGRPKGKVTKRDEVKLFSEDVVEVRLNPDPEHPENYFLFAGNCMGTVYDSKRGDVSWNGNWTFKNKVEDSGETVGGVETCRRSLQSAPPRVTYLDLKVHHFGRGFFSSFSGWKQEVDWRRREA